MCSALDYQVRSLQRTRIMNIRLDGLSVGQWRDLTEKELQGLCKELNIHQENGKKSPTQILDLSNIFFYSIDVFRFWLTLSIIQ